MQVDRIVVVQSWFSDSTNNPSQVSVSTLVKHSSSCSHSFVFCFSLSVICFYSVFCFLSVWLRKIGHVVFLTSLFLFFSSCCSTFMYLCSHPHKRHTPKKNIQNRNGIYITFLFFGPKPIRRSTDSMLWALHDWRSPNRNLVVFA